MKHEKLKELLFALYDKELPDAECQEIEAHIKSCSECRQTYQQWERITGTLFRRSQSQPSEAFVQGVMGKLEALEENPRVYGRPMAAQWLVPTLGLGFVALLIFMALPEREPAFSTETLLLANGKEELASKWVFLSESPETDDLLGFALEEP